MESPSNCGRVAHFGVFEADLQRQRLEKRGAFVQLQDKPFQVLALFLERAGEVVSRDELRRRLWSAETFVEFDEGANAAVGKLRYALGTLLRARFLLRRCVARDIAGSPLSSGSLIMMKPHPAQGPTLGNRLRCHCQLNPVIYLEFPLVRR